MTEHPVKFTKKKQNCRLVGTQNQPRRRSRTHKKHRQPTQTSFADTESSEVVESAEIAPDNAERLNTGIASYKDRI